jgi:DNA-binding IclR family transcriptional regulator
MTATDEAWANVAKLGPALSSTLLALARLVDEASEPVLVDVADVARLTGKSATTTARDLHRLAERGVVRRRCGTGGVRYGMTSARLHVERLPGGWATFRTG